MQSRGTRLGIVIALVALAAVLFVVLRDESDSSNGDEAPVGQGGAATAPQEPAQPPVEVIRMREGAPEGGVRRLSYSKGDRIRIAIEFDQPQEDVHIHGYDLERLNPRGTVRFDFPARLDGLFELEAHGPSGDVVLAEIRVQP